MIGVKTETPSSSPAGIVEHEGAGKVELNKRLYRYKTAKERALSMASFLSDRSHDSGHAGRPTLTQRLSNKIKSCASYLVFRDYYTVDKVTLHDGIFCHVHQLCPMCAIRRGAKLVASYMPKYSKLMEKDDDLHAYLVTLTVRNGDDLGERMKHLQRSHRVLQDRRRDWLKKGRGLTCWKAIEGAVGAYEVTNRGRGWHPHIHMVVMTRGLLPLERVRRSGKEAWSWSALEREWAEITGDSMILDVRPFGENQTPEKSFCEVFKYALKFSDMPLNLNWEAYNILKKTRMIYSYGSLRGVEIDEEKNDEEIGLEDLPYIQMIYRYFYNKGYVREYTTV